MSTKKTGRAEPCAACGKGDAHEVSRVVEIQPLGRATTFTRREWKCPDGHGRYTDDEQGTANEAAELAAKASAVRSIEGDALRKVREIAGATQPELEAMLDLGKNTIARWETGQRPLPGYIATLVRLLALHPTALRELAAIARLERGAAVPAPTAATSPKARAGKSPPRGERAATTAKRRAAKSRGA